MKGLQKTKGIFKKINIKREKKEKELKTGKIKISGLNGVLKETDESQNIFNKLSKQILEQTELLGQKFKRFELLMRQLILGREDSDETLTPPIQGDMSVDDVENFLSALYENYELLQTQYQDTKDETFFEMAMDTQLAISEINEIKGYLMERGRYDKSFDNI